MTRFIAIALAVSLAGCATTTTHYSAHWLRLDTAAKRSCAKKCVTRFGSHGSHADRDRYASCIVTCPGIEIVESWACPEDKPRGTVCITVMEPERKGSGLGGLLAFIFIPLGIVGMFFIRAVGALAPSG